MSIKAKDIYKYIDSIAPFDTQCEWDNSGLLIGSKDADIKKIGFSLDASNEIIAAADKEHCDLLVTHHPIIFNPLKKIDINSPVYNLIKSDLNIICAHTNYDKSDYGVNYILAKKLGLTDIRRLKSESDAAMCFIGEIGGINPKDFAEFVNRKLGANSMFYNANKAINTVAVCGGAGGEFIYEAAEAADAFVTGEVHYHQFLDAAGLSLSVYAAGHFETENPAVFSLYDKIKNEFDTECVFLKRSKPYNFTENNYAD